MLQATYMTYNGIGLLLEILGLIMLLVPDKISLLLKPNVGYRTDEHVYPIRGGRIVNDAQTSSQIVLRTSQTGIIVIMLGLAFQFIAMF